MSLMLHTKPQGQWPFDSGEAILPHMSMQTTLIMWTRCGDIATDKELFFVRKMLIPFLFLNKNICCGYSLEVPCWGASTEYHNICFRRGASNKYPQCMFSSRNKKNSMWISPLICSYVANKLSFHQPMEVPYELWLWLAKLLLRSGCLGVWMMDGWMDNWACLHYKLTCEPKGSGELIVIIIQTWTKSTSPTTITIIILIMYTFRKTCTNSRQSFWKK